MQLANVRTKLGRPAKFPASLEELEVDAIVEAWAPLPNSSELRDAVGSPPWPPPTTVPPPTTGVPVDSTPLDEYLGA